jgi:hypothetical protein
VSASFEYAALRLILMSSTNARVAGGRRGCKAKITVWLQRHSL